MLDNIDGNELASVARRLRERWTGEGKKFLLETSGGITENNLRERAITGRRPSTLREEYVDHFVRAEIDILSTSSVHQSVAHIDFSLKIQIPPR